MDKNRVSPAVDPDEMPDAVSLERCFVFYEGKLRANENGRQRFGDRFRRAGFDIDKLRSFDELEAALKGSWHIVMGDLESDFERRNRGKNSIDHQIIRARYRGDFDDVERLQARRDRIQEARLRIV